MLEGLLRFAPDLAALIRYDESTKETDKAVYIDAEGNETPICGGGSSDYSTATVTVTGTEYDTIYGGIISNGALVASKTANGTQEITVVLYKGEGQLVTSGAFNNAEGDVEIKEAETNTLIVTGDGSVSITGLQ